MAYAQSGDIVRVHYTGRLDDGSIFDSSRDHEPMEVIVGEGKVIPRFEEALTQMEPGDEKVVTIPADEAYGPRRADLLLAVDRTAFPTHIEPEVGLDLQVKQENGETAVVTVADVSDKQVTLDANHPLAGHDLTFDLEVVEIRARKTS